MVLVTHDLGVVAGHTDRVVVMYAGEIVETAPTIELFRNMRMPYTEALFKSIPTLDTPTGTRLPTIEGRVPDPTQELAGVRVFLKMFLRTRKMLFRAPRFNERRKWSRVSLLVPNPSKE